MIPEATASSLAIDAEPVASIAEAYLGASLTRAGIRRPASQAFALSPHLRPVALRLCLFVTDEPSNRFTHRPILDAILEAAFVAFFSAGNPRQQGSARFLQACITRITDVLGLTIVSAAGDRWNPTIDGALGLWRLGREPLSVDHDCFASAPDHHAFRASFLCLICPEESLRAFGMTPSHSVPLIE